MQAELPVPESLPAAQGGQYPLCQPVSVNHFVFALKWLPVSSLYLPAAQSVQARMPYSEEYLPVGHSLQ